MSIENPTQKSKTEIVSNELRESAQNLWAIMADSDLDPKFHDKIGKIATKLSGLGIDLSSGK